MVEPLLGLVDKSMVVKDRDRYYLLETLRAFGRGQLERSSDNEPGREALLRWAEQLAYRAYVELGAAGLHQSIIGELESGIDDIRSCLDWASETGRQGRALLTAAALLLFWVTRAFLEGYGRLQSLVESAEPHALDPSVEQAGLFALASIGDLNGDHKRALEWIDRAALVDPTFGFIHHSSLRSLRARILVPLDRVDEARAELALVAEHARADGDAQAETEVALHSLYLALYYRDLDAAPTEVANAIHCAERSGLLIPIAHAHEMAAIHALLTGAVDTARPHFVTTLEIISELDHRLCRGHALENVSVWAFLTDNHDLGVATFDTARRLRSTLGIPIPWFAGLGLSHATNNHIHPGNRRRTPSRAGASR